ncbi:ACT domain-containing protein [Bounagaea algeriensis]
MPGERALPELLAHLEPELLPGEHVFTTVDGHEDPVPAKYGQPVVAVREAEGTTLVLPRAQADEAGLPYEYVAAQITLRVHSALDAVGLSAAVSTALADAGLSCNIVAGYHHDHLFVPAEHARHALQVLRELATSAAR